jgi:hypothetical protein
LVTAEHYCLPPTLTVLSSHARHPPSLLPSIHGQDQPTPTAAEHHPHADHRQSSSVQTTNTNQPPTPSSFLLSTNTQSVHTALFLVFFIIFIPLFYAAAATTRFLLYHLIIRISSSVKILSSSRLENLSL